MQNIVIILMSFILRFMKTELTWRRMSCPGDTCAAFTNIYFLINVVRLLRYALLNLCFVSMDDKTIDNELIRPQGPARNTNTSPFFKVRGGVKCFSRKIRD